MKLSGHYKEKNHNVELITDYRDLFSTYNILDENEKCIVVSNMVFYETIRINNKKETRWYSSDDIKFDKVIISKVFTDTSIHERLLELPIVEYGGTGFFYDKAEPLPEYIEHHKPDYHLYDDWINLMINQRIKDKNLEKDEEEDLIKRLKKDFKYYTDYSIGFTTRGCFRKCEFCVNKNYNRVQAHSPVEEFLDEERKYICLLDDNILGFGKWKLVLEQIQATGKSFEFKQGMDLRLMTKEKAEILSRSKYIGDYIFAFDNIADRESIEDKLRLWRTYCKKTTKFYVFCGFDRNDKWDYDFWVKDIEDTFKRVKILMRFGCLSYIMRFERYKENPYAGTYINLARWCNQPNFYKKMSYREFCVANGENSSTVRYMNKLEIDHPEIARRFYDMRYKIE